jgi:hypothetical protein
MRLAGEGFEETVVTEFLEEVVAPAPGGAGDSGEVFDADVDARDAGGAAHVAKEDEEEFGGGRGKNLEGIVDF